MELIHEFASLYGTEKNGKTKVWTARVYVKDGYPYAHIEYGQIDGKKQITTREYTEGKNVGKKNETTPLQQCMAETKRKWQDKQEKENYSVLFPSANLEIGENNIETSETTNTNSPQSKKIFPMLAHKYEPNNGKTRRNDITFPCYVQPKLDGLRCVMYMTPDGVVAQSRTGSYFETLEHICISLTPMFMEHPEYVLDGELYTKEMPFEELAGLIKKKKVSTEDKKRLLNVKYHVYDIVNGEKYEIRKNILQHIFITLPPYLEMVPTQKVDNKEEFYVVFGEYIRDGYEGIMLRNGEGKYRENYRSHDLQKYKEFKEDEYTIVGYKEAEGRDKGTIIWICNTEEGREFSVRPRGTLEYRKKLLENASNYLNKKLTVIYQELSEQNVPRFPVGKAIREDY